MRNIIFLVKPPLANALVLRSDAVRLFVFMSVCSSVCGLKRVHKTRFSHKLSNLEQWSLLTTNRKSYVGFSDIPIFDP